MLIDVAFVILLILAIVKGLRKGLIVALFSIVAYIAGLAAALKLSAIVAEKLSLHVNPIFKWLPFISFLLVFLLVAFLVRLVGRLIQKSVETIMLGWANRIGGVILYMVLYTFIFSLLLFFIVQIKFIEAQTLAASVSYPFIQPLGPKVINTMGAILPIFENLFETLQNFFGGLSNKI